ncbi:MAG TPA: fumarylacetoacetate hydrolase family protein [Thermomicrobiales bacterium]|nr:fumarylacetoacetate hydrolase family protein [Thermomicrobiales bacterium]
MKLVSFEIPTVVGPVIRVGAVSDSGNYVDLRASYAAFIGSFGAVRSAAGRIAESVFPADMVEFIEGGDVVIDAANQAIAWASEHPEPEPGGARILHDPAGVTLLPPLPRPRLIRDFMSFETHLKNIYPRMGREIPPEWYNMPIYYKGNSGSVGAHDQDVPIPAWADALDYEFELAMVIGKGGRDIPREQAMDHVFGFMIYNDFSERVIQGREMTVGLGPAKGKDFNNAHVFGPYLVTIDEIANPYDIRMTSRLNGEVNCDDSTATMHWKFEEMIAHASASEELVVGEVFGTGTVGNGSLAERGEVLKRGDVIELEASGLGVLRNRVV